MSGTKTAWLVVLTVWTAVLTLWQVKQAFSQAFSEWESPGLFARWNKDGLRVAGSDGRWMVTHLENLEDGSIARFPEPVWVVESGGVLFSMTNLAKLEWKIPAGPFDDVLALRREPPPSTGARIQALYFRAAKAKVRER